jgi:choloylglycine hydrolase
MSKFAFRGALVALVVAAVASYSQACTGIRLKAKDGSIVHARTMEFGFPLDSKLIVIPRSFELQGTTTSGKPGLAWNVRYGVAGMNGFNKTAIIDGLNEKGLAGGIFYMPGYAEYQAVSTDDESKSLAPWELLTWILTSFATVDEVRNELPLIKVGNVAFENQGVLPVHYIVHDATGKSLVIEFIGGKLNLHDDPIGVITNAPEFDWHLKNLNNYVNLSVDNAPSETIDGLKLQQFGQGSGLVGVPGDFTPPSRFVRAAILGHAVLPGNDGQETVRQAFHVLDAFDIPKGVVRDVQGGKTTYELTQWTSASDTNNKVFYFHSYNNRRMHCFDLAKANLSGVEILTFPLADEEDIEDFTPPFNNN